MIEKGVDASCSEDESDVEGDVDHDAGGEKAAKVPGKTTKALIEKLKGQPDIKECFIPLMKLDVDSNVLLKHLGYKWVGESIGTIKDKVYYSQVRKAVVLMGMKAITQDKLLRLILASV